MSDSGMKIRLAEWLSEELRIRLDGRQATPLMISEVLAEIVTELRSSFTPDITVEINADDPTRVNVLIPMGIALDFDVVKDAPGKNP